MLNSLAVACCILIDWAVQNRHLACVKLLLEGIGDIDVLTQNGFGRGSVTEAFQSDDPEIRTLCLFRFPYNSSVHWNTVH